MANFGPMEVTVNILFIQAYLHMLDLLSQNQWGELQVYTSAGKAMRIYTLPKIGLDFNLQLHIST